MKVYLGTDHKGYHLKETIKKWLEEKGFDVSDLGAHSLDPLDDYPVYAAKVAENVSQDAEQSRGILFCGSGVGVDVVANKFPHVRSGLGMNTRQVKSARTDDDINVLSVPADYVNHNQAQEMIDAFLKTPFDEKARHERRIREIEDIEKTE